MSREGTPASRSGSGNKRTSSGTRRGRRQILAGAASIGGLTLAGCMGDDNGNGEVVPGDDPDTIVVARPGAPDQTREFLEPALEEFENEFDVEVEPIYQGWSGWPERLDNLYAQGEQPHVQLMADYQLPEFMAKGPMVQLDDRLADHVTEDNVAIDIPTIDGDRYLVPDAMGAQIYMYRRDLYEEAGLDPNSPPDTFDEMADHLSTLDQNLTEASAFGAQVDSFLTTVEQWMTIYGPHTGNEVLDEAGGSPTFNTDEGIEATENWRSLEEFAQPEPTEFDRGALRSPFSAGDVAVHNDGPWIIPTLEDVHEDLASEDSPFGFALLPEGPAGRATSTGYDGWVVTREDNVEASVDLVNFLNRPENNLEHCKAYGSVTPYEENLEDDFFDGEPWPTLFEQAEDHSLLRPYHEQALSVYDAMTENLQAIWIGQKSVEEGLADAEEEINAL